LNHLIEIGCDRGWIAQMSHDIATPLIGVEDQDIGLFPLVQDIPFLIPDSASDRHSPGVSAGNLPGPVLLPLLPGLHHAFSLKGSYNSSIS
jgi:hypothetical protein